MLLRTHDGIGIGDAADVLHGTVFVIRTHNVINLLEGIPLAEVLLVEIDGGLGHAENQLMSHVVLQTLSDKDSLRDVHGIVILKNVIRSRTNSVQIRRDLGGLLELIDRHFVRVLIHVEEIVDVVTLEHSQSIAVGLLVAFLEGVRDCLPVIGHSDNKSHLGLEIGLVKAREYLVAVEGLKLRIQVLVLILQVGESVQTRAVSVVLAEITDLDRVPGVEAQVFHVEGDLVVLVEGSFGALVVVDDEGGDGHGDQVDEEGAFGGLAV